MPNGFQRHSLMKPPDGARHVSASSTAKVQTVGGRANKKVQDGAEFIVCLVKRMLHLDDVGGVLYLTNNQTHERLILSGQAWELVEDSDDEGHDAALLRIGDNGQPEALPLASIFKQRVVMKPEIGERMVVDDRGKTRQLWSLDAEEVRHRPAAVYLRVGPTAAEQRLNVFVFGRPRGAQQRVFWALIDIYHALMLKCYAKQASKWVGTLSGRWQQTLKQLAGQSHIVCGTYMSEYVGKKAMLPWSWTDMVPSLCALKCRP